MNHSVAIKVLRLSALEKRADARFERAMESGDTRRASRAANLVMAVHGRWPALIGGEVTTYSDSDR